MPAHTLKLRRSDPQAGKAAYRDEHTVELAATQSARFAIL